MTRPDRQTLLRKLRQARVLCESATEMQTVADGLFAEAKRLVDEIADMRAERPLVPVLALAAPQEGDFLGTKSRDRG